MKTCCRCGSEYPEAFFNRDRTRADGLYPQCKTCSRGNCKRQYEAKRDAHVAAKRVWKAENRDKNRQINTAWRKANLARCAAYRAQRRAALLKATPPWADAQSIRLFYEDCPKGWHVDHIEPLRAKDRCGLHTIRNLQYLPADMNFRKNNRTGDEFATGGGYV